MRGYGAHLKSWRRRRPTTLVSPRCVVKLFGRRRIEPFEVSR
jgi:hypothetical protein